MFAFKEGSDWNWLKKGVLLLYYGGSPVRMSSFPWVYGFYDGTNMHTKKGHISDNLSCPDAR